MCVLAIALVRWPRLAGALLILALIDFGWGVGSYALRHSALGAASLLPTDKVGATALPVARLAAGRAHPLAAFHQRHRPCDQPHLGGHARAAIRRRASLAARNVVATFGGSTTYDIGAGEGDTWSDRLAAALEQGESKGRFFVVNHGVPGYTTVEHLIQTAFYQTKFGKTPRCAIYYVGWNDLRNAHIPDLDPGLCRLPSAEPGRFAESAAGRRLARHDLAAAHHG